MPTYRAVLDAFNAVKRNPFQIARYEMGGAALRDASKTIVSRSRIMDIRNGEGRVGGGGGGASPSCKYRIGVRVSDMFTACLVKGVFYCQKKTREGGG